MSSDAKSSTPRNGVNGDMFKYLPAEGTEFVGESLRVASIYFSTDEPRNTLREKNENLKHQCTHPEEYLEVHAEMALKDMFLPIDGGWDGDPTTKEDSMPEGYLGTLLEALLQLAGMRWRFEAYADPREGTNYNIELSKDRARVTAAYAMKYIWDNDDNDDRSAATHEQAMKGLLQWWDSATGSDRDQKQKQWTNTYWDDVVEWRATTWWNMWMGFTSRSGFYGDSGMDPSDLDQESWPQYRKVDIYAHHVGGSAERSWETGCNGLGWLESNDYTPDDKDNWISVVMPGRLRNFNKDDQFEEDWDPGADPDAVTQKGDTAPLLWVMKHANDLQKEYEQDDISWHEFATGIVKIIYGFRYFRLVQHEFLRGHTPPERGKGPGFKNPGTSLEARSVLCEGTIGGLGRRFEKLIQHSERGAMIFGGNINSPGIKKARQIAHQYHIRTNPWYRVAYLEEMPGTTDQASSAWYPNLDGRNPSDLVHWPPHDANEITDLDPGITQHLDPINHGGLVPAFEPEGRYWATGIPKALADEADYPDPDGYMNGQKHYTWLGTNGGYTYNDLAYMDKDNPILTQSARDNLKSEYVSRNGDTGVTLRSHLEQLRYTVRQAMILVEAQLSDDNWERWLDEERTPYPDYTDPSVWNEWKDPLPSPFVSL